MVYFYIIFFAAIQSLTEFLPVSSSGHLVILHRLIDLSFINELTFDVILHAGTLLSLVIFFRKTIWHFTKGFIKSLGQWQLKSDFNQRMPWLIILANLPAIVIGYFLDDFIESAFRSISWVIIMLIIGSLLFMLFEKISKKFKTLDQLGFKEAMLVGLAQVIAFIPGTSRSGITTVTGLALNFKRAEAARFSFLLSIPVIFGATVKKISEMDFSLLTGQEAFLLCLGLLSAAFIGYFAIKWLLKFFERYSLNWFALYRLVLAAVLIFIFWIYK